MKRVLPNEIYQCKNWLLKNKRFDDYNNMLEVIKLGESDQKLPGPLNNWLIGMLKEYCAVHKIGNHFNDNYSGSSPFTAQTPEAEDLFERLMRIKREQRYRR